MSIRRVFGAAGFVAALLFLYSLSLDSLKVPAPVTAAAPCATPTRDNVTPPPETSAATQPSVAATQPAVAATQPAVGATQPAVTVREQAETRVQLKTYDSPKFHEFGTLDMPNSLDGVAKAMPHARLVAKAVNAAIQLPENVWDVMGMPIVHGQHSFGFNWAPVPGWTDALGVVRWSRHQDIGARWAESHHFFGRVLLNETTRAVTFRTLGTAPHPSPATLHQYGWFSHIDHKVPLAGNLRTYFEDLGMVDHNGEPFVMCNLGLMTAATTWFIAQVEMTPEGDIDTRAWRNEWLPMMDDPECFADSNVYTLHKNWVPISHGGRLFLVPHMHPWRVYEFDLRKRRCARSWSVPVPELEHRRGGRQPVVVPNPFGGGDALLTIMHLKDLETKVADCTMIYTYRWVLLARAPPFQPLAMSEVFIFPDTIGFGTFVKGVYLDSTRSRLVISLSHHDMWIKIHELPLQDVLKRLVRFERPALADRIRTKPTPIAAVLEATTNLRYGIVIAVGASNDARKTELLQNLLSGPSRWKLAQILVSGSKTADDPSTPVAHTTRCTANRPGAGDCPSVGSVAQDMGGRQADLVVVDAKLAVETLESLSGEDVDAARLVVIFGKLDAGDAVGSYRFVPSDSSDWKVALRT